MLLNISVFGCICLPGDRRSSIGIHGFGGRVALPGVGKNLLFDQTGVKGSLALLLMEGRSLGRVHEIQLLNLGIRVLTVVIVGRLQAGRLPESCFELRIRYSAISDRHFVDEPSVASTLAKLAKFALVPSVSAR